MVKIRKVVKEDSDLLLSWRNNPEVYRFALKPHPVEKANHELWFANKISNPRCFFYLGLSNNAACGSVRFDLNETMDEAEVSISIAPEFWGKGIGTELMKLAEEALKIETQVQLITATVLNENIASMKLFERAQFRPRETKFTKKLR